MGRSAGEPRRNNNVATVAMTTSKTGTTMLNAVLGSWSSRIRGNRVTLATNRIDPPSTMPSSTIRVRSVGRRLACGKVAMPAMPTSRPSDSAMSLGVRFGFGPRCS